MIEARGRNHMRDPSLKFFLIKSILQAFSVEIVMPLGLALHLAIETAHTGISRDFLCLGDVRLNLPKFTWLVTYFIVELLMFYKDDSTSHT